ncbi:rhodanese-like domain-containing protein [Helicobacter turcicus]|uniref:Rhodanese-like domain-containing protein n=1 Tax=Helicobacter turcicus TaxID=2867412 RepID=A0ABS7JLJ7_9HELI|nr:rhodanese-like domain-containing protein [Helicobacter turcicus]MBX7490261.1 rhodanese-like domain-containing protein [Helicobacter turcicus]MBX7545160.1 rhodanese-like domain-containing protein [Helicobacter turcicus]
MYIKNKSLAKPISLNSLDSDDFIVIDLRSKGYFLISHIKGALNIESLQRIAYIAQENPQKKILLYCHSGATAADFGSQLVQKGLENIYYIDANYFTLKKYNIPQEGEGLE